ncbi:TetR/AcrR family transcriptional regulator [Nocardia gamkensis]|uniref:TetR/AcrR family transcriptional regulator n=1 Tax=Nocardia gamkensis TaxID=352869 RepID=UPI0033D64B68
MTREDYFEAAMKILATHGHHALKMSTLCNELGVTTGSFYNYFGNWSNFIPELLKNWENERTLQVLEISSKPGDPFERIRVMKELAIEVPHASEAAIRAWSNGDPKVAEFQRRVDRGRFEALLTILSGLVHDKARAELLAIMGISLLIGEQSWRVPVDLGEMRRLFDEYEAVIKSYADVPVD